jgi:hypothetical protein
LVVARSILRNPLRARLLADARHYPFLGSEKYSVEELLDAVGEVENG